jgi:outer membrane protein TolC
MKMHRVHTWAVASALLMLSAPTAGQDVSAGVTPTPVSLAAAEAAALEGNGMLQAAEARRDAAAARVRGADAFLFPALQANAGVVRTDDPVGVFGTKLRQERFTEMDFALPALNTPDPVTDWNAGAGAQWQIGSFSKWAERDAARSGATAAEYSTERTAEAVVFRTRVFYLQAVQAQGTLDAAGAALEAARATAERVARRVAEGMGTDADRLQAEAAEAEARARVQMAEMQVRNAQEALGAHLGWGDGRLPVPAEMAPELPDRSDEADALAAAAPVARADVRASAAGVAAARAQARAVGARRLPALEAFGQLSTHAPGLGDDRGSNWTVGVQLSVPVFTGFGLEAGRDAAEAAAAATAAEHAARIREAAVEVSQARRGLATARTALDAVSAAQEAAAEAVRLLRRRYDEGMTTLADLLQAEARSAQLDAALVEARTRVLVAQANLDFALGDAR